MANITRKIMIAEVAKVSGIRQPDTKAVMNAFVEVLTNHLKVGDKVNIDGFGTFTVSERAERQQKNPHTGEKITVPACIVPKLKFGKNVKDAVNGRE